MKKRSKIKEVRNQAVLFANEEKLELRDYFGIKDPTPYEAVKKIIRENRLSDKRCG